MGTRKGQPDLRYGSELCLVLVEHAISDEMVALEWDDVCKADGRLLSLSKMKQLRVPNSIISTVICRNLTWWETVHSSIHLVRIFCLIN